MNGFGFLGFFSCVGKEDRSGFGFLMFSCYGFLVCGVYPYRGEDRT